MSRDVSALYRAYANSPAIKGVILVSAEFDTGELNLWNGYQDLVYGGKTYLGAGYLMSMTPATESKEVRANGVQVGLTGMTTEIVSLALNQPCQGRTISIKMALVPGDVESHLNFNITVSGAKYYVELVKQAAIEVKIGDTYRFDQSNSTNTGHNFRISTTIDGTHGGGSQYTTGWTEVGTKGQAGAYNQWVVPDISSNLYYYCQNHAGYGGTLNTTSAFILPDPITLFEGVMDKMVLQDSGDESNISVFCESRLVSLENNNVRRYTPEDQKIDYPNDLGFDFVAGLQTAEIRWGS